MAASAVDEATNVASHQAVAVEGRMVKGQVKATGNPGMLLGFDQTVAPTKRVLVNDIPGTSPSHPDEENGSR